MIPDIHDKFFKAQLGQIDRMRDLLQGFLPREIADVLDFETLAFLPTERVGEGFGKTHLDLSVSVRLRSSPGRDSAPPLTIYVLLEHKSSSDPGVFLQLLRYMTALWTGDERAGKALTPVLPFVLSCGKTGWTLSRRFFEHMNTPGCLHPYSVDFSPFVLDVGSLDDETIREKSGNLEIAVALMVAKHIFGNTLSQVIARMRPLMGGVQTDTASWVVRYLLVYYGIEARPDMERVIVDLDLEEKMPSIVDTLEEKGRKEGLKEGLKQGREEDITKLLRKKILTPSEIASALDVDLAWVLEIGGRISQGT